MIGRKRDFEPLGEFGVADDLAAGYLTVPRPDGLVDLRHNGIEFVIGQVEIVFLFQHANSI